MAFNFNKPLRERDIELEERRWRKQKDLLQRHQKIQQEKLAMKFKKPSTTKLLVWFLFTNCTAIELFTGWATIKSFQLAAMTGGMVDFAPLTTLIGVTIGEVMGFAVYAIKSAKENTAGGIVYDLALNSSTLEEDKPEEENDGLEYLNIPRG